jgi:VIT1/CCC1 family predicted Fe2+/Mn2+ transporter
MYNKFFNAFEMLLLGAVAVAVGYGIGKAFPNSG